MWPEPDGGQALDADDYVPAVLGPFEYGVGLLGDFDGAVAGGGLETRETWLFAGLDASEEGLVGAVNALDDTARYAEVDATPVVVVLAEARELLALVEV